MGFACDNDLPIFSEIILVLGQHKYTIGQIKSWLRLVKRYEDGDGPVPDVIHRPPIDIPDALNRAMQDKNATATQKMTRLLQVKRVLENLV